MGVGVSDGGQRQGAHWVAVPHAVVAFLNRVMALPGGVHTIQLVKEAPGAEGIAGWSVIEGRMERPREVEGGTEGSVFEGMRRDCTTTGADLTFVWGCNTICMHNSLAQATRPLRR